MLSCVPSVFHVPVVTSLTSMVVGTALWGSMALARWGGRVRGSAVHESPLSRRYVHIATAAARASRMHATARFMLGEPDSCSGSQMHVGREPPDPRASRNTVPVHESPPSRRCAHIATAAARASRMLAAARFVFEEPDLCSDSQTEKRPPTQAKHQVGGRFGLSAEWSGRRESNPRIELGKLALCH